MGKGRRLKAGGGGQGCSQPYPRSLPLENPGSATGSGYKPNCSLNISMQADYEKGRTRRAAFTCYTLFSVITSIHRLKNETETIFIALLHKIETQRFSVGPDLLKSGEDMRYCESICV